MQTRGEEVQVGHLVDILYGFIWLALRYMGPSIKYVTLFLANFGPPPPCHTLSHIPGAPQKVRHTSRTPRFLVGLVQKNQDKSPQYKFSLNCSRGLLSGGFCPGVFCLEGFVRGGFCPYPLLSEYICYNRKLKITLKA